MINHDKVVPTEWPAGMTDKMFGRIKRENIFIQAGKEYNSRSTLLA